MTRDAILDAVLPVWHAGASNFLAALSKSTNQPSSTASFSSKAYNYTLHDDVRVSRGAPRVCPPFQWVYGSTYVLDGKQLQETQGTVAAFDANSVCSRKLQKL